jgi:hypothetical protein
MGMKTYSTIWSTGSHIFQHPGVKIGTAPIIIGAPGAGKNTFTDVICDLLGEYAERNITSIDSLVGHFNATTENKMFIVLNEVKSTDDGRIVNWDRMKSLVTDSVQTYNQKYIKERTSESVCNLMFVTNNDRPIKIDDADRRYLCSNVQIRCVATMIILIVYIKDLQRMNLKIISVHFS